MSQSPVEDSLRVNNAATENAPVDSGANDSASNVDQQMQPPSPDSRRDNQEDRRSHSNSPRDRRSRSRSPRRSYSPRRSPRRSPSPRDRRRDDRGRDGPNRTSLYIRNLYHRTRKNTLHDAFSKFGEIVDIHIPLDYYTKEPRGFAYVEFKNPKDAEEAMISMEGQVIEGRKIFISYAEGKRKSRDEMRRKPTSRRYSRSPPRRGRYDPYEDRSRRRRRSYSRSRSRSRSPRRRDSRRRRSRSPRRRRSRTPSRSSSRSPSPRRSRSTSRDRERRRSVSPARD